MIRARARFRDSDPVRQIQPPRWIVTTNADPARLVGALSIRLDESHAQRVAKEIATALELPLVLVLERRGRANPTLVHHGIAQRALWHILGPSGQPAADLYVGRSEAEKIARGLADYWGARVRLVENYENRDPEVYRQPARGISPHRLNPAGTPVRGEVWTTTGGGRCRIEGTTPTAVQVYHSDTGNREWIERREFLATYKPPRRSNPPRTPRRQRRAIAGGRFARSRYLAGASIERHARRDARARTTAFDRRRGRNRNGRIVAACQRRCHNPGCPCDPRCCGARGRVCECRCRGANHQRSSGHVGSRLFANPTGEPIAYGQTAQAWLSGGPTRRNPGPEPSRIRQRGTRVTASRSPEERVEAIRRIVQENQYAKVDGTMIDLFTASVIISVFDALSDANKAKFAAMPAGQMGLLAFKVLKKSNPEARNPRAPFQAGERVTVPYTGRSSYFGRKVTRTREHATIEGVNPDGTALVLVRRGQGVEQHAFPLSAVRRLPQRGSKATASRVGRVKARLELKGLRSRRRATVSAIDKAERDLECLEARAKLMDPESAAYRNAIARMGRLRNELEAERMIAGDLERQDPDYADPFAIANPGAVETRAGAGGTVRIIPQAGKVWLDYSSADDEGGLYQAPSLAAAHAFAEAWTAGHGLGAAMTAMSRTNPTRRVRKPRTRKNPGHSGELARTRRLFQRWHSDAAPRRARLTRVRVPARPRALARLGELVSLTYESDKYAGTPDNPKGRRQLYEHETKRPRPVIATDQNGHVHLVGGRMKPTADGLIN